MKARAFTVGKRIKRLRLAKGWTQRKLASELSMPRNRITRWEMGVYLPAVAIRQQLARKLGTSIEVLFLDRSEQIAAARDKAMKRSMTILDNRDSSPAAFNAATNVMGRAETSEGKTAGALEEEIRQQMRTARDEFFRKLARLRGEEG